MMDTERLIDALSQDRKTAVPMTLAWALALAAGAIVAVAVFLEALGPRPDIGLAAQTWRFLLKFAIGGAVFAPALWILTGLARPAGHSRARMALLLAAPVMLAVAVMVEVSSFPPDRLPALMIGNNALVCLFYVPLIGLGPLAAFLLALRHGAPQRPALSGMIAGLAAAGLAMALYAAHCPDDSPLFVAVWYTLAAAFLAVLGALAGRLAARW